MTQVSLETKPSNKVANDFKPITNYEKEKKYLKILKLKQYLKNILKIS